jgi:CheY-like chemotaxis protein
LFFSRIFRPSVSPNSTLPTSAGKLSFYFRRLVFGIVCILVYGLLDRTTVYLQIWPSISAWYPPIGLMVALLVGIGPAILPVIFASGYLAGYVNYHQDFRSLQFLLINPLVPIVYGSASLYLRRKLTGRFRIRTAGDVTAILGVSLLASLVAAASGTAVLVWSGESASADYVQAAFNWWIGDAVALSSLVPFLLEFVIPWCRRYLGSAGAEAFSGGGRRVLLVEDNAVYRTLAERLLQKRGFAVSIAVDGMQAIAATQSAEFDLVLMDIQMPEMDGFEATAEIRKLERHTGQRTPIIALTAHALKEDRERCLAAGMDAYVTKPIRPAELFGVIQDVLQSATAKDRSALLPPYHLPADPGLCLVPLPKSARRETSRL